MRQGVIHSTMVFLKADLVNVSNVRVQPSCLILVTVDNETTTGTSRWLHMALS